MKFSDIARAVTGDDAFVFDFDGTLAVTDSAIWTFKDGKMHRKITQSEVNGANFEPGEILKNPESFVEFDRVGDYTPGPAVPDVEKLAKIHRAAKTDLNAYVLTARRRVAAEGIAKAVYNLTGVKIPMSKIITVGDRAAAEGKNVPSLKNEFLEKLRHEVTGSVVFWEDDPTYAAAAKLVPGVEVRLV